MTAHSFAATLRRQWLVIAVVLLVGVVAFIVLLPHFRKFTATSTMLASNSPASSTGTLDPSKDPISSAVGLNDLQTLATSEVVLKRVAAKLRFTKVEAARFPSEVKAKALYASDILPIAVTDRDPDVAIAASNAISNELQTYSQHIATGRYDELIDNLKNQIADQRKTLSRIDDNIQGVSSGDFYVTPETGTSSIDQRLVALAQQEGQLEATVNGDEAAADMIAQQPAITRALARHEIIKDDPSILMQKEQLGKDIAQLNVGLSSYSLTFPGLRGYILQVRKEAAAVERAENKTAENPGESEAYVNAQLNGNKARAALAADSSQLAAVREQLSELRGHLAGSAATSGAQVAQLRRARAAGEDVYTDLSQRLAKAKADRAQAGSIGSVVVIDSASSASPALLGRPLVLGAGLAVIFIWLAVTLAFVFDNSDDRLRTPEAIGKLYGHPVFTPVG